MLYRYFMLARKEGLLALEGHLTDIQQSSIAKEYPLFSITRKPFRFLSIPYGHLWMGESSLMSCRVWLTMRLRACTRNHMLPLISCT